MKSNTQQNFLRLQAVSNSANVGGPTSDATKKYYKNEPNWLVYFELSFAYF